jgi:hypothetical protein
MPKKPVKIEVVEEGDERFLLKVFPDGSEERRAAAAANHCQATKAMGGVNRSLGE